MAGRLVAAMFVLLLGGCSSGEDEPIPAACLGEPAAIAAALARAPGAVMLDDGTRLSTCVSRARTNGALQTLGVSFTRVADDLRGRVSSDPQAAVAMGYLAGAVRAGAASSSIAVELARRIERATALDAAAPQPAQSALQRGLRAGESSG